MAWFLDTNACIAHLRGRHPQLSSRWGQHRAEDLAIPLTTYAELLVGAEKSAATALAHGATLVTNGPGEFSRVPGLLIEDWTQP